MSPHHSGLANELTTLARMLCEQGRFDDDPQLEGTGRERRRRSWGAWNSSAANLRVSDRYNAASAESSRGGRLGFRCVRSAP